MKKLFSITTLALTIALTLTFCNTPKPSTSPTGTDTTGAMGTMRDSTGAMRDTSGRTDTSHQQLNKLP